MSVFRRQLVFHFFAIDSWYSTSRRHDAVECRFSVDSWYSTSLPQTVGIPLPGGMMRWNVSFPQTVGIPLPGGMMQWNVSFPQTVGIPLPGDMKQWNVDFPQTVGIPLPGDMKQWNVGSPSILIIANWSWRDRCSYFLISLSAQQPGNVNWLPCLLCLCWEFKYSRLIETDSDTAWLCVCWWFKYNCLKLMVILRWFSPDLVCLMNILSVWQT